MEGKTKLNNRLWQARRRMGLEQKQVANLLNHKSSDQISRYERGARLPGFQTACKLAIIYGTTLQELFPEHYRRYIREIEAKAEACAASFKASNGYQVPGSDQAIEVTDSQSPVKESTQDSPHCHFARLLDKPIASQTELSAVRRHVTRLVQTMVRL